MQKTGIEYLNYTYNFVKGRCPNTDCSIYEDCYMKRTPSCWAIEKNPILRLDTKTLFEKFPDEPKRIGIGFNLELFHKKVPSTYIEAGLKEIRKRGQRHTWLFLTKCPERYAEFDFPKNCWLGVTVTNQDESHKLDHLKKISQWYKKSGNVVFVSHEPLLGVIKSLPIWLNWDIIGALTGPTAKKYQPHRLWIDEMIRGCNQIMIPVFLKNNLAPIWGDKLIQEYPKIIGC